MAVSNESRLTNSLRLLLKKHGAYVNKNHGGPNSQGRPDLEGCYRGLHFGFEVKMPGKESNVTPLQQKNLEAISEAGGMASVVSTKSDVRTLIRAMDNLADHCGLPPVETHV